MRIFNCRMVVAEKELPPELFAGGGSAPRRVFALWWDAQAGEGVPELNAPITTSGESSRKKGAGL